MTVINLKAAAERLGGTAPESKPSKSSKPKSVYNISLFNNDSDCGIYDAAPDSVFLISAPWDIETQRHAILKRKIARKHASSYLTDYCQELSISVPVDAEINDVEFKLKHIKPNATHAYVLTSTEGFIELGQALAIDAMLPEFNDRSRLRYLAAVIPDGLTGTRILEDGYFNRRSDATLYRFARYTKRRAAVKNS